MNNCCILFGKRTAISKDGTFNPVNSVICGICKAAYPEEEYFKLANEKFED